MSYSTKWTTADKQYLDVASRYWGLDARQVQKHGALLMTFFSKI